MRILLDIDGVVADLVGELCQELGKHGVTMHPEHFRQYDFKDCVSPFEYVVMQKAMERRGFCRDLPGYKGAGEFCERLRTMGEVVAVTKPFPTSETWAHERAQWCKELGISKVVHTSHKELVKGDVLIEDHIANVAQWLHAWPHGQAIVMIKPWNVDHKHICDQIGFDGWGRTFHAYDFTHALDLVSALA